MAAIFNVSKHDLKSNLRKRILHFTPQYQARLTSPVLDRLQSFVKGYHQSLQYIATPPYNTHEILEHVFDEAYKHFVEIAVND